MVINPNSKNPNSNIDDILKKHAAKIEQQIKQDNSKENKFNANLILHLNRRWLLN